MDLGFGDDWRQWDQTERVKVELSRRPATQAAKAGDVLGVAVAKRTAVRGREKSPSGGVYVGYESNWRIPAQFVPRGLLLKPADVVVVDDPDRPDVGRRWTVLTADLRRQGTTWLLGCVDLVLAADLRDAVTVERADRQYDAAGVLVKRWPSDVPKLGGVVLYDSIPCRFQPEAQETTDARGIRGDRTTYAVIVDRDLALDVTEDRLVVASAGADGPPAGTVLDMVRYTSARSITDLSVIAAQRRP